MDRPDGLNEDDLLAYARGDATPDEAARIEAAAARDPALKAELALMAGLKGALAASTDRPDARAFGWKRLEAEIGRAPAETQAAPRGRIWQLAAVFLGAIVLVQGSYIALGPDAPLYRTVSEETDGATLGIAFAPGAAAADIEALLRETGARIVDGPSAIGLYRIAFEDEVARTEARAALEASALVELVAEE
ncbi:hypothetical protein [Jannaschia aquimarina]|uniref:Uncharacterized protein n=1 Tax=Jannaschia aquimarina TaxID=935700 RepID=A0A0D1EDN6_9RHOB|nr:hypothetical protein [Jannaschia aquimarina]KIT15066.1 hypothetical protein jaqu_33920 [Jannaschia aquimarina]SNS63203.1 hypothetical protein SAMN05421775_101718 [Jannaschia aquimarina]